MFESRTRAQSGAQTVPALRSRFRRVQSASASRSSLVRLDSTRLDSRFAALANALRNNSIREMEFPVSTRGTRELPLGGRATDTARPKGSRGDNSIEFDPATSST